jgi:hypothetical protein
VTTATLVVRGVGLGSGGWDVEWFIVKDRVWHQRKGTCRFLCVKCLERHIGRKLTAADFKRSARANFVGNKSALLRQRMRGLKPAKRLRDTHFKMP